MRVKQINIKKLKAFLAKIKDNGESDQSKDIK